MASSTAAQRSGASAVSAALAPPSSASRSSGESMVPAFGGREDTRRARTIRPASRASCRSSSHWACSDTTRSSSFTRSWAASSRVSSSRAALSAATTTERRSRRSSSSASASAASAIAPVGRAHAGAAARPAGAARGRRSAGRPPPCASRSRPRSPGARRGCHRGGPLRRSAAARAEALQHRPAVGPAGAEPLRLGPFGQGRRCRVARRRSPPWRRSPDGRSEAGAGRAGRRRDGRRRGGAAGRRRSARRARPGRDGQSQGRRSRSRSRRSPRPLPTR